MLVTGAAGFIGSNFVERALARGERVVVLDSLTYAGHLESLREFEGKFEFVRGDICDRELLGNLFKKHGFARVINFAAESHVDRSIENAADFVKTNVMGVFALL
ncbi:MAG: NAD-dependent epimerase/dehydratase family protein, partial [Proteobacteria bacterium]